jgi:biotin carboxyl carrier protein
MKLEIQIRGRKRTLEIERPPANPGAGPRQLLCRLDGQPIEADAVEVATGVYSILLGGRALEVRVQPVEGTAGLRVHVAGEELTAQVFDPRTWRGRRGAALEAEGRQQIIAPMPGKVVRVLVKQGDEVEAGHGLLVVEAMKMQNEIRSPKSGKVERVMVAEGQAVTAGEALAIVS